MRTYTQLAGLTAGLLFVHPALAANSRVPDGTPPWRDTLRATAVVDAVLAAPGTAINDHGYAAVQLRDVHVLKGPLMPARLVVQFYPSRERSALARLEAQRVIAYVLRQDERRGEAWYFLGYPEPAVVPYRECTARTIEDQAAWLVERVPVELARLRQRDEPTEAYQRVAEAVRRLPELPDKQAAYERLKSLGVPAVPALILLADQDRALPPGSITVPTPGGFEAQAHYDPKRLIDLVTVVLEELTGEGLNTLHNGGSERERQAATEAWRAYLVLKEHFSNSGTLPFEEQCQPR